MKQIIILLLFFITGIAPGFAQPLPHSYFTVIDIQKISANNIIVSCRDGWGRTIQLGSFLQRDIGIKSNLNTLTLGLNVWVDFTSATVSQFTFYNNKHDTVKYKIVKPAFSQFSQCCVLYKTAKGRVYPPDQVVIAVVKGDTANGLITFFEITGLTPYLQLQEGQPIYKTYYNTYYMNRINANGNFKSRVAILKPGDEEDIKNNIFYSYEFKFMPKEIYNNFYQANSGSNYNDSSNQTAQTQKLNTDDPNNNKAIKHEVDNSFDDKKWEMKQNLTAKGATGRVLLNLPKDAECVITIYERLTETTQQEIHYSSTERSFSLVPGLFNIQLSGSIVNDVPVQKGMDTRIKAGVLNVVASGTWTLYNEKKSQNLYYSSTAKKIGLPIGTYQLQISGSMQQVVIKDGETVDF